jgi:hypothetical protein
LAGPAAYVETMPLLSRCSAAVMSLLFSLRFRVSDREEHQRFQRVETSHGGRVRDFDENSETGRQIVGRASGAEDRDRNSLLFFKKFAVLREFEKGEFSGGLGRPSPSAGWLQIRCKCSQNGCRRT